MVQNINYLHVPTNWWEREEQQNGLVPSELGVFEFLVLCFEQVAVAGAVINCFQAVDFDGGDAPLSLPVVMDHVPQVLMVIVSLSLFIVWGTRLIQWGLRAAMLDCSCPMKFTTRRRYLPPIIALLKVFFLMYVTLTLNSSEGLEWKQESSALCSALILVMCELVEAIAIAHTWVLSRVRGEVIYDWGIQEAGGKMTAKQLVLTFFDRWKDCGMVSSFLNQSEMILLLCEVPSMVWASWTCCQRGSTPERLSYQLHRYVTVMTIVMGMNVVEVSLILDNDIAGAVVFLVADVVLTGLRLYEGRHEHRERRRAAKARRLTLTPTNGGGDTSNINIFPSPTAFRAQTDQRVENGGATCPTPGVCQEVNCNPHRMQPERSDSVVKQCLELKRLGVWKKTVFQSVPRKEWVYAFLDCAYSVLVVLNVYETTDGAETQIMPNLLGPRTNSTDEDQLIDEVDKSTVYLAIGFSSVLGLSLLARWYVLYSSKRTEDIAWAAQRSNVVGPNFFAIGVVATKFALLPVSIYIFAIVLVQAKQYTPKRGVNALVANLICAIAAARAVDSLGRAVHGLERSAVGLPGADAIKGSRNEKASIALQVFWDRFNDFLAPLSIVHLVISTTEISKNFIVVYFLLVVCILHAMIAYVDAIDITGATYIAERLGYLVAVTFLVRNSAKYVERKGIDLLAPVLLVAMEFTLLMVALGSIWAAYRQAQRARRKMEKEDTNVLPAGRAMTRSVPMLASTSSDWSVLSSNIPGGTLGCGQFWLEVIGGKINMILHSTRVKPHVQPQEKSQESSTTAAICGHLARIWRRSHIERRSEYSIERLLALRDYCRRTSLSRATIICILAPAPAMLMTLLIDCVPLRPPGEGWQANYAFWMRWILSTATVTLGAVVQLQEQIPSGAISNGGAIVIALGTATTDTLIAVIVAAEWRFPIPFGYVVMVGPYVFLGWVFTILVIGYRQLVESLVLRQQLKAQVIILTTKGAVAMAYPIFTTIFYHLSGYQQAVFVVVMPVFKKMTKYIIANATESNHEYVGPAVVFSVDVFNVFYVAICMQMSKTMLTTVFIIMLDSLYVVVALHDIF
ncbi:unnamed protein product [Phytophthora fragariaefolia]|uniref:Unnamed protein product n=1 Tax=Phytophthora fragariaefolia TaxID=1490495 RepID=A0A9W6U8Z9_9STRA|nr:unnamed protein product [Phytophthora fragariaefolia]